MGFGRVIVRKPKVSLVRERRSKLDAVLGVSASVPKVSAQGWFGVMHVQVEAMMLADKIVYPFRPRGDAGLGAVRPVRSAQNRLSPRLIGSP